MPVLGPSDVALLAEGVDRNCQRKRRFYPRYVALLAEGVDRNYNSLHAMPNKYKSPSSRRAWIEITLKPRSPRKCLVALLAEGVDRNISSTVLSYQSEVALLAEGVDRNRFL